MRGEVTIVDVTDTKIPWPIGKTLRARSLVIYKGLAKAIRRESNQAICYWFGVTPQTVTVCAERSVCPAATKGALI